MNRDIIERDYTIKITSWIGGDIGRGISNRVIHNKRRAICRKNGDGNGGLIIRTNGQFSLYISSIYIIQSIGGEKNKTKKQQTETYRRGFIKLRSDWDKIGDSSQILAKEEVYTRNIGR